jgi:hypothetical protein
MFTLFQMYHFYCNVQCERVHIPTELQGTRTSMIYSTVLSSHIKHQNVLSETPECTTALPRNVSSYGQNTARNEVHYIKDNFQIK